MGVLSQNEFVRNWDCDDSIAAFRRLTRLLALYVNEDELGKDTPGMRNRRYIGLHRDLVGRTMEAQAKCPRCTTLCEFPLPRDAMLASPLPDLDHKIEVDHAGRDYRFRLPTLTDIEAFSAQIRPEDLGRLVAEKCRVNDMQDGDPLPDIVVDKLDEALDRIDPLASPRFDVDCGECNHVFSALVDVASFVARELDLLTNRLLRDVNHLARAYGWSEAEILAIPPARRSRYLAILAQAGRQARPVAV